MELEGVEPSTGGFRGHGPHQGSPRFRPLVSPEAGGLFCGRTLYFDLSPKVRPSVKSRGAFFVGADNLRTDG